MLGGEGASAGSGDFGKLKLDRLSFDYNCFETF